MTKHVHKCEAESCLVCRDWREWKEALAQERLAEQRTEPEQTTLQEL